MFAYVGCFTTAKRRARGKGISLYRTDDTSGKLIANDPPCVRSRYGAGPRHISFHPARPFAYLINELDVVHCVHAGAGLSSW